MHKAILRAMTDRWASQLKRENVCDQIEFLSQTEECIIPILKCTVPSADQNKVDLQKARCILIPSVKDMVENRQKQWRHARHRSWSKADIYERDKNDGIKWSVTDP